MKWAFLALLLLAGCVKVLDNEYSCPDCNIVLITIDTVRADHLPCYGYSKNTTPNICRIAEEGVLFEKAYSPAPLTIYAIRSIMTGAVLSNTNRSELLSFYGNATYLAELLQEEGYKTAGFTDHYGFLDDVWEGFDKFENYGRNKTSVTSDILTRNAAEWMKENSEEKFFLWVHYFDPHFNYNPLPEYEEKFGYSKEKCARIQNGMDIVEMMRLQSILTKTELDCIKALYDAELYHTDKYVGELVNTLDSLDIQKNTLLIITADHGEEFMEHGRIGHETTVYNELLHVPLIMRSPRLSHSRIRDIISTKDIFSIALNKEFTTGDTISRSYHYSSNRTTPQKFTVISDDKQLILIPDIERQEFYDLTKDIQEKNNILNHTRIEPLKKRLTDWIKTNKVFIEDASETTLNIENQVDERLRSLGYVT